MLHPRVVVLLLPLVLTPLLAQQPALAGLDPVLLCQGKDERGKAEFPQVHRGHLYLFATAATRDQFAKDPERWGIQFGGACARMGPLGGLGDAQRFLVHEQRIYVFASDDCRKGFQSAPAALLAVDDAAPQPTAEQAAQANDLLARAVAAHGGKERLQHLRTWSYAHSRTSDGTETLERVRVQWPDRVRFDQEHRWSDKASRYARVGSGEDAFFLDQGVVRDMAPAARTEMLRDLDHDPLVALRAAVDGRAVLAPGGRHDGPGGVLDELVVWQRGHVTRLGIDAEGRVVRVRCRARGPGFVFGEVVLRFAGHRQVNGVLVPTEVVGSFAGKEAEQLATKWSEVAVDAEFAAETFVRPK